MKVIEKYKYYISGKIRLHSIQQNFQRLYGGLLQFASVWLKLRLKELAHFL